MADLELKAKTHPRIHITAADVPLLKERARTTHKIFFDKLIATADAFESETLPELIGRDDDDRGYGEQLSMLAMAYLLTEDKKYLAQCRRLLRPMLANPTWQDGIGLVTGHQLGGVCTYYDWLYDTLDSSEREAIRDKIRGVAAMTWKASREQRVWWHDMFFQNWCHVPTCGLAYAAGALAGEADEAGDWIAQADFIFSLVKDALSEDGGSEEGQGYMGYAWQWILRYFDIACGVFGRDHFDSPWLRNAPYAVLYAMLPRMQKRDNLMAFGDARRRMWDGPTMMMFKTAHEYKDAIVQGFARHLIDIGIGIGTSDAWLNLVWYDPDVPAGDYTALPTTRVFGDLSTMYARSSWQEDAMLVGFKCTANSTAHVRKAFPGRDLGVGHAHPDAASFQVFAFGEWLAIDPGYSVFKVTHEHNTLIVNGVGQLGGDHPWFDGKETVNVTSCDFTKTVLTADYDYARADASAIYKEGAGIKRFIRHLIYLKPHDLLTVDEIETKEPSEFTWLCHADQDITAEGSRFFISKGEARARIAWLAPGEFRAEVYRQKLAFVAPDPLQEIGAVAISPSAKSDTALLVSFLSFYKAGTPETEAVLKSSHSGIVVIELSGAGRIRTLRLDLAKAEVSLA
jgi:hypothetical protein